MTEYYRTGDGLTEVHRDVPVGSTLMAVATNETLAAMIRKALEHYEASTSRGMDDPGLLGLVTLNRALAEQRDDLRRLVGEIRDALVKLANEMRHARSPADALHLLMVWSPQLANLVAALAPAPGGDARDARSEAKGPSWFPWVQAFYDAHKPPPPEPEPFQTQRWYKETGIRAALACRHPEGAIAHTARPSRTWCERCGWDVATVPMGS